MKVAPRTIIGDVEVEIGWLELCCAALSCDVLHNLAGGRMRNLGGALNQIGKNSREHRPWGPVDPFQSYNILLPSKL